MGIKEFTGGIVQAFGQLFAKSPVSKIGEAQKRQYSAAQYGRLFSDWVAAATSQDSEAITSLRQLRNRSRQMVRDNEHAKSAWRTVVNNVVGQGMDFQCQIKNQRGGELNEDLNTALEEAFEDWSQPENCDVSGKLAFSDIERLVIGSWFQSGEVFIRKFKGKRFGDSSVPFALQVIEADQVDEYYNSTAANGNRIRMGVEVDSFDRPTAYWMFESHPGDYQFAPKVNGTHRIRVPADEIYHLFLTERPGQTRGIPPMHAALSKLRHVGGYDEAEIIRARLTACKMMLIETPDPDDQADYDPDTQQPVVEDGRRLTSFEPGMIDLLKPGEKATLYDPQGPANSMDPFLAYLLRSVAAAIGMSYESLTKDFSRTTYSSARAALVDERDCWKILQNWMIMQFQRKVAKDFIDMAVLGAGIGSVAPDQYKAKRMSYQKFIWHPRGWDWVDPEKDAQAAQIQVRSGFSTITEILAMRGKDFTKWLAQRVRELKKLDEAGVVLDTTPQLVVVKPGKSTSPRQPTDAEADDLTTDPQEQAA